MLEGKSLVRLRFPWGRGPLFVRRIDNRKREDAHVLGSEHQSVLTRREVFGRAHKPIVVFRLRHFRWNQIRLLDLGDLGAQDG
jgi:hypothetical protein